MCGCTTQTHMFASLVCAFTTPVHTLASLVCVFGSSMYISLARFSSNYRAPGLPFRVHHPHVIDRSWDAASLPREAQTGLGTFIPKNFRMQKFVESVRTGEFLGSDFPFNLLPKTTARRYNVEHRAVPETVSLVPRVDFYARLNVWAVAWRENGKEYHRWFRVQVQGFKQAKYKAEAFRRMLETSGRLDDRRQTQAGKDKRDKKFARTRLIRRGLF